MPYYARVSLPPGDTVHLAEVESKARFTNDGLSAICGREGACRSLEATKKVADCVFCLRKEREIPKERVTKEERWWTPLVSLAPPRVARPKATVPRGRTTTHKPKRRGRKGGPKVAS